MKFDQNEFNRFVLENNILGFFKEPITLKSGRTSNWYFNWRNVSEDAFLMDQLTDYVLAFVEDKGIQVDCFYGVPEGATKVGVLSSFKLAKASGKFETGSHVLAMGRGKPKEHGQPKDRYFLGVPKGATVVLEDVTTTGGSLLRTLDALLEVGVSVSAAVGLTNRMEVRDDGKSVADAVAEKGVVYHSMGNALKLLPLVCEKLRPDEAIVEAIEKEFTEYGVEKLKLR